MKKLSVEEICEALWTLEQDLDLFKIQIEDIHFWHIIRWQVYSLITNKANLFEKLHDVNDSIFEKMKHSLSFLVNSLKYCPLKGNQQKDIIIFDHERKMYVNEEYIDIYTYNLLQELDDNDYLVLERAYKYKHWTSKKDNRKYLDCIAVRYNFEKYFISVSISRETQIIIEQIEKFIHESFDVKIDLQSLIIKEIKLFKYRYKIYTQLFNKRKPKKIFVVVAYGHFPMIAAAKAQQIEVIEIQHGVISPFHMGYSFPRGQKNLPYFPDKIYCFGQYWVDCITYPIEKQNIIVYGFPYMNEKKNKFDNIQKNNKQILFLSQGAIGKQLSVYAAKLASVLKDYKIIYKLHPGEYDRWKSEYTELAQASSLSNLEVIDHNNKVLYHYMAQSEFQVGVFSTAIYEGLSFGCKTILVELPGMENMRPLLEKQIAFSVYHIQKMVEIIQQYPETNYNMTSFFNN